ncbi:nucleotidyltransferase domain-containing protein, partial [Thermoflexus sp.]|uniref:nucleotidyltransferase domain-containing protein n=1 Tax=Thermoflexus sp. TaxID=1969742 RepID=UPI00260380A3
MKAISLDRDELLRRLREAAAEALEAFPELLEVRLIGSLATGTATGTSDVDLLLRVREISGNRSAAHRHLFHPSGVKQMTGCFLLHRPMARRPGGARSAARGISTGVTSRGTPGRAFQGGQPIVSWVEGRVEIPIHL